MENFIWVALPPILIIFILGPISVEKLINFPSHNSTASDTYDHRFFLSPTVVVNLSNTRPIRTLHYESTEQLRWLLWHKASHANTIFRKFAQLPHTDFFHALIERTIVLGGEPTPFEEPPYSDPLNEDLWSARSSEFRDFLEEYFELVFYHYKEDPLQAFLELKVLSQELGHTNEHEGDYIEGGFRIKLHKQLKESLKISIETEIGADFVDLSTRDWDFPLLWYKNRESFFLTGTSERFEDKDELQRVLTGSHYQHFGSLLMNKEYETSGDEHHWLLDSLNTFIRQCIAPLLNLRFNPTVYMIPKTQYYTTSHHLDTHVAPHITLYQHLSGSSVFYFLPILYGTFASFIAHHEDLTLESKIDFLIEFYRILDNRNVGTISEIKPGELLVVTPYTSHLVQSSSEEPTIVRAVELFLVPSLEEL